MTELVLPSSVSPKMLGPSVTDIESGESVMSRHSIVHSSTLIGGLLGLVAGSSSLSITSTQISFSWAAVVVMALLAVFGAILGFLGGTLLSALFKLVAQEDQPLTHLSGHMIS